MFKNMKLGTKILGGFGLLILIAMILGGLAVYNMNNVKTQSDMLAQEYAPEVDVANRLERSSYMTMYEMRGYGYTEEQRFLDAAQKNLGMVDDVMVEVNSLADKSKHLTKLKDEAKTAKKAIDDYKGLVDKTTKLNGKLDIYRGDLNTNSAAYMTNCSDFLAGQNKQLMDDIDARQNKLKTVIDTVNLGSTIRVLNFKAQATGNIQLMKDADQRFSTVYANMDELRKITSAKDNLEHIDNVVKSAKAYQGDIKSYLAEHAKGAGANYTEIRNSMDVAASQYVKNCQNFLDSQNAALRNDIAQRNKKINLVSEIVNIGNETRIATFKSMAMRDPALIEGAQKNFEVMSNKFDELRGITTQKADLDRIDKTQKAADGYKLAMNNFLDTWKERELVAGLREKSGGDVLAACQNTAIAGVNATNTIAKDAAAALSTSSIVMVVGLFVAFVVGLGLAIVIARSITKPINRIIAGLTDGSQQVSSASGQISSSSQSLAEGATEQAASLEETSSALEEMASMTRQNADNAGSANQMMKETSSQVAEGAVAVKNMAGAMTEINSSSEEISKIIKTIEEIAFQTNLLALNAAVEAARAGDAGKGFAVVADEVRNLAQRSAQAARDTAELIEGTVVRVKNGNEIVTQLEKSFRLVEDSSNKVAGLIAEISAASNEQAQGVDQVNTAVAQMDKVTQQNAANAEESASASEEMSAQAEQLNEMERQLVSLVEGSSGNGQAAGYRKAVPHTTNRLITSKASPSSAKALSREASVVNPNQVIPFDESEFKDF
ncbi:MAG: methyl-accepting chemotaxis protein [Planctomycetes bacterium]|nr:methyl-accepting chemotaxis protein [Planctomycetota bacterium]